MTFKHNNWIVAMNTEKGRVFFCERKKESYAGWLHFVDDKVENGKRK